jgi:hypothetical protein
VTRGAGPRKAFAAYWFSSLLLLFGLALPASIAVVVLAPLTQIRFAGAVTLAAAAAGALVCCLGLRLYAPRRQRAAATVPPSVATSAAATTATAAAAIAGADATLRPTLRDQLAAPARVPHPQRLDGSTTLGPAPEAA